MHVRHKIGVITCIQCIADIFASTISIYDAITLPSMPTGHWTYEGILLLVLFILVLFPDGDNKISSIEARIPIHIHSSRSGCMAADKARSGAGHGGPPQSLVIVDGRRSTATRHLAGRGLRHWRASNLPVRLVKAENKH